jgi:hypothetical protein
LNAKGCVSVVTEINLSIRIHDEATVTKADPSSWFSPVDEVLEAFVSHDFYDMWVRQPTPEALPLDHERYTDVRFWDMTKRCLGALDGTHVPAHPPELEVKRTETVKALTHLMSSAQLHSMA